MLRVFILLFFLAALITNSLSRGNQHFSSLATSFLEGKTYFLAPVDGSWVDTAVFNGHHYWPQGPFPAVILAPFILASQTFHQFFYQGILNYLLVIAIFYLIYKISRKNNFSRDDALLLSVSFCVASTFLGVTLLPTSWYFAQVVTVFLIFCAIYENLGKKRYWLIGLIFSCIFATRTTAGIGIVFFVLDIIFSGNSLQKIHAHIVQLFLPVLLTFGLLGYYNFVRFNNFLEQGYSFQLLFTDVLYKNRSFGLFSLAHVPGNLYRFLLAGPLPVFTNAASQVLKFPFIKTDNWGMSIFVTSPYFLYMLILKYRDKASSFLLVTCLLIAIPIFLYYGIGFNQFGYRYSLDFLPFLFFLLIRNYNRQLGNLSVRFKSLVILSVILDLYLFWTWIYFHYA